jgi:hypothetical protein
MLDDDASLVSASQAGHIAAFEQLVIVMNENDFESLAILSTIQLTLTMSYRRPLAKLLSA